MTIPKHTNQILVLFSAAIAVVGCAPAEQVSFQSGGMTHTFTEGKDATKNGFLLPVYPDAKPTGSVANNDVEESSNFLMLSSQDSVSKIGHFYEEELQKNGWHLDQKLIQTNIVNLNAHKANLEASVLVSTDDDKSSISLSVAQEPEGKPKVSETPFVPDKLNPPTD